MPHPKEYCFMKGQFIVGSKDQADHHPAGLGVAAPLLELFGNQPGRQGAHFLQRERNKALEVFGQSGCTTKAKILKIVYFHLYTKLYTKLYTLR